MSLLTTIFNPVSIGETLDNVRETIIDGNIGDFSDIGRAIGAIGALLYIAYRVWGSMARAEPIDVFPLLKPFCLCFLIINFSIVTDFVDTISGGIESKTETMVQDSQTHLSEATTQLENAKIKLPRKALEAAGIEAPTEEDESGWLSSITDGVFKIVDFFSTINAKIDTMGLVLAQKISKLLMGFASVAVDTIATFFLIILGLLGPIVFGVACFDGFGHMITNWLSRYFSIALWVPISKILSIVLNNVEACMLINEASVYTTGQVTQILDQWIYVVFYIMGIIAYCTIPTIAGWIIDAGSGAGSLLSKVTGVALLPITVAGAVGGAAIGGAAGAMVTKSVQQGVSKISESSENTPPQG